MIARATPVFLFIMLPFLGLLPGCCGEPEPRRGPSVTPTAKAAPAAAPVNPAPPEKPKPPVIEMVNIEAGKFKIGPNMDNHDVEITRPFKIGKYEVTQAQYQAVMGENPSENKGDNLPVENVSWDKAMEFCQKLSKWSGKDYTLPTEAQWEYACRAGTTTDFSFGEFIESKDVNFDPKRSGLFRRKTIAVGELKPNAWGLNDMHGNVAEWCSDWYAEDFYKKSPIQDPTGPPTGTEKVFRGGSMTSHADECSSWYRGHDLPNVIHPNLGFRVVQN
jgi:formylglycine-generating enzyme required for sulfatase activity